MRNKMIRTYLGDVDEKGNVDEKSLILVGSHGKPNAKLIAARRKANKKARKQRKNC